MKNPLKTRRGFRTFAVLTWALAMLVGVIGVGVFLRESLGAFVFAACLLTSLSRSGSGSFADSRAEQSAVRCASVL
jgi:nicotinamide riboside transporter PnuC